MKSEEMLKIANQLCEAGAALKLAAESLGEEVDEEGYDDSEEVEGDSSDGESDIGRKALIVSMKRKLNSK